MLWLKDEHNKFSFEQVKNLTNQQFNMPDGYSFSRGYTSSGYWFKFDLNFSPELPNNHRWLLEIPFPLLDYVDLYIPDGNGGFSVIETGDRRPFSNRVIDTTNFVFSISPEQNQGTYYLNVKTQDSLQVPLILWNDDCFIKNTMLSTAIQGIYFGIMLVMVLYNLFIFLSIKELNYLYYSLYISGFIFFQASLQGVTFEYFWPNNPWWANINIPFFGVLSIFFATFFVRGILNTKSELPGWNKLLIGISYLLFLSLPIILFASYDTGIYIALFNAFSFFSLVLIVGILAALKGNRTAKIFLLAWIIFITTGLITLLGMVHILPIEYGKQAAVQLGSALEVILLSMALADRINLIEKEKVEIETRSKEVLLEANKQLENSNRLKNEFIATISHEVRTPMNGVLGSTQLLLDTPLDSNQINYVNTINHSGKTLLEILNNILDYSKIEADKLNLVLKEFNLEELINQCAEFFSVISAHSGVNLYVIIDNDVPHIIRSDPLRIKQVLLNLLSNAFKFTNQGQIVVRIKLANTPSASLIIEVEDSGNGMNIEQQDLLFQPFVQLDSSSSREKGGTGLGLAISKKLVSMLGGEIGINSTLNKGATFWFTLKLNIVEQGEAPYLKYQAVCVFLDNPYQESLIKNQLQDWGTQVISHHLLPHIKALEHQRNITVITNDQHVCEVTQKGISKENIVSISNVAHQHYRTLTTPITGYKLRNILLIKSSPAITPIAAPEKLISNSQDFSALKVMAVDDNSVNRMIINKMLKRYNIYADVVSSGTEAVEKIHSGQRYNLILMDIEMPIKDGYQSTKEIRQYETMQSLTPCKIVAVSAHSMKESKEKALASGMDDFLAKPVEQHLLTSTLQETQSKT